jgi:hypothetical protein
VNFSEIFEKYSDIKITKTNLVAAELFHADGQTDTTKLTVAFINLANAPTNSHALKADLQFQTKVHQTPPFQINLLEVILADSYIYEKHYPPISVYIFKVWLV